MTRYRTIEVAYPADVYFSSAEDTISRGIRKITREVGGDPHGSGIGFGERDHTLGVPVGRVREALAKFRALVKPHGGHATSLGRETYDD